MQQLQLNIIPFKAPVQEAEFSFYKERINGSYPVFKNDLNGHLNDHFSETELANLEKLYTDFEPPKEDALVLKINLYETPRFANHYYRFLIRNYFIGVADMIRLNFTSETEVWIEKPKSGSSKYKEYFQFTIKVQHGRVTDGPELVLSFDGTTKVLNKSIAEIQNFQTELYNWVN